MILLFKTNDDNSVRTLANYIDNLNEQNKTKQKTFRITIKENRAVRSKDQNARYWVMLKAIGALTGYTKEDLHDYYKKKFNCKWILDEYVPQSTTELDTLEMTVYQNKVENHATEFHGLKFISEQDKNYVAWLEEVDHNYNKMFASI